MSDFQTASAALKKPDPSKRVNYTFGLVLGTDEFVQEQFYLMERTRLHQRLLHGYGTVSGLQVTAADTQGGPEVRVTAGAAVNPRGETVCVRQCMCARLNPWLQNNRASLEASGFTPPRDLSLVVVLAYDECETDTVPVPGEPCRTQEDAMQASRIADSFKLKLCLNPELMTPSLPSVPSLPSLPSLPVGPAGLCRPPACVEEAGVARLATVMRRIRVSSSASSFATSDDIAAAVRSIGVPGDPPPPSSPTLFVHPSDARARIQTLFRTWVTEVLSKWNPTKAPLGCGGSDERSVMLAEISLPVDGTWQVGPGVGVVKVDDSRRAILLSTRVLEEPLLAGVFTGGDTGQYVLAPSTPDVSVVAGGYFVLNPAADAKPAGPMYNDLKAVKALAMPAGHYVLNWTRDLPYAQPVLPSPAHTYVVKGVCQGPAAPGARQVFEFVEFRPDGILVRILDTAGGLTARGFMVEITRIGGAL